MIDLCFWGLLSVAGFILNAINFEYVRFLQLDELHIRRSEKLVYRQDFDKKQLTKVNVSKLILTTLILTVH
jgi:hypothetical protein